jgi:acetyl-CoA carboxylase, biotin carboxylase subunit
VGRIVLAREPAGPGIRVESALYDGIEVTPYYDSLLAKVTAWGRNREGARTRMKRALDEFRVVGVATNIPYLKQILEMPDFIGGHIDTGFLDRHEVFPEEDLAEQRELAEIAALLVVAGADAQPWNGNGGGPNGHQGGARTGGWRQQMSGMGGWKGMGRWPKSI